MKRFLTFIFFFTLSSELIYADIEPDNSSCIGEEIITELHGTTVQVTHSVAGKVLADTDEFDHYTFKPASSGKFVVSYSSTENSDFAVTAVTDCSTNSNVLVSNAKTLADTTITVASGKTVHIYIKRRSNKSADYTFSMVWTPDAIIAPEIDTPDDCSTTGASSGQRDFCRRSSLITRGGMVTIGNTVLVPPDPNTQDCSAYSNGDFISDFSTSNADANLCSYKLLPGKNSTSARLTLPDAANSEILFAGLYWQSIVPDTALSSLTGMNVHIQNEDATGGGAGLKAVTVDKLDYELGAGRTGFYSYAAFSNITSVFTANNWTEGNIIVEGIPSYQGNIPVLGNYGAWSLVVIYKDPQQPLKNFSVFDGWKIVKGAVNTEFSDLEIGIQGFYTPKVGSINSSVSIFVAEGDKYISGDDLTIVNELTGTQVSLGTQNSSIDNVPIREPFLINNNGIDIHTYSVGDYLQNQQSFVRFHFKNTTNSTDTHWPSMIAFETDIYEPSFCYDYAYSQNSSFFTNENNGTEPPRIEGDPVQANDLVTVNLYVRNLEDSDIEARNVLIDITDINTSQAVYSRDSVKLTYPNSIFPLAVDDTDFVVGDSFVKGIDIGSVRGKDYFYAHYELMPSVTTIDMPINATMRYDLVFSDGTVIPFESTLGGEKLPMCGGASSNYSPTWSIFDIVDANLYSTGNKKYNIPTQVARRPGYFNLVSFEPADLTTHKPVSTIVAVELIDAGAYHVTSASCSETSSSISGKIWITFGTGAGGGEPSDVETLNIAAAISGGLIMQHPNYPIASPEDFYSVARKNAAFRISYNVANDDGEELVQLGGGDNAWQILNFTKLVQDIGECSSPVLFNPNSDQLTTQVAAVCGNSGGVGGSALNNWQLARCQECIYGYRTKYVCSRDNFAIRPEALDVKIFDRPQEAGPEVQLEKVSNAAVGYIYKYDITATSHTSNLPTIGYTQYFNDGTDANLSFEWSPLPGRDVSGCNDTDHQSPFLYIKDGLDQNAEGSSSKLGRYDIKLIDREWTKVDVNPPHHTGINPISGFDHSVYFEPDDCILNSSDVPLSINNYNANKVGCDVKSSHTNLYTNTLFEDHNLTFRPYEYRVYTVSENSNSLLITKGENDQNISANDFVYINNIQTTEQGGTIPPENIGMSTRYRAFIRPVGAENNDTLPNFVNNCYAEPLQLETNMIIPASTQNLRRRVLTSDLITDIYSLPAAITTGIGSLKTDVSSVMTASTPVNLMPIIFTKSGRGTVALEVDYNYDRERNVSVNPLQINFSDSNLSCSNIADCTRVADLIDSSPHTDLVYDNNVTYIYGRLHSPRQRVAHIDPNSIQTTAVIPLEYEFYCDSITGCDIANFNSAQPLALSPIGLLSPDDVRWYRQNEHNVSVDGNATATQTRNGNDDDKFTTMQIDTNAVTGTYTYSGSRDYPYKATIELFAPNWLLYNRYNGNAIANDFELEFFRTGNWAGRDESGMNIDPSSPTNVNRRVEW
ncbi:MAG: hypothetical protein IBX43_01795 [Campylobacterales bacterium]|nr:hypothetical protein [Campylobacterales bacterium]